MSVALSFLLIVPLWGVFYVLVGTVDYLTGGNISEAMRGDDGR